MTQAAEKRGFPTWAKVLIGIVVVGLVLAVTSAVVGFIFIQKVAEEATDPEKIPHMAATVAQFPEPLPEGFNYFLGFGFLGNNILGVKHDGDDQTLVFVSMPLQKDVTADELVKTLFQAGIKAPGAPTTGGADFTSARGEEIKKQGEQTVGGEKMPYIIGTMSDKKGERFEGMVGCVVSKDKKKTVLVYGMQPGGKPYDMQTTAELLGTIKGF